MESAEEFIARKDREWSAIREGGHSAVRTKDITRQGSHSWVRDAWTWRVQHNYPEKVLVIERLRQQATAGTTALPGTARIGDVQYRFGYYIVGRIGRAAGRWTWGQFSPLVPQADLAALLERARLDGTLLPWPAKPLGSDRHDDQ